jgi:hypothetical protein
VDNALLYTDGPVFLTASSGPCGELVLHVRGSGIGLSVVRLLIEARQIQMYYAESSVGLMSLACGQGFSVFRIEPARFYRRICSIVRVGQLCSRASCCC